MFFKAGFTVAKYFQKILILTSQPIKFSNIQDILGLLQRCSYDGIVRFLWYPIFQGVFNTGSRVRCFFESQCHLTAHYKQIHIGPHSAVSNVSDCRSRGHEFDPGLDTFFHGDWSWNNFSGHFPPFSWIKKGCCQLQAKVCAWSTG